MGSATLRTLGAALGMALGTWFLGWWAVAAVGMIAGATTHRQPWGALQVSLAGGLAWGALLLMAALSGPVAPIAGRLGRLFGIPAVGPLLLTVAFGMLLAGFSAALARSILVGRPTTTPGDL